MARFNEVSNRILNHYLTPRNCGVIEEPTAVGESGDPDKGVKIRFFLTISNDCIDDIRFQTFGCITSIASASILTELVKGKPIAEISNLAACDISNALGGVPQEKMYCCELAIRAFRSGLESFRIEAENTSYMREQMG